MHDREQDVIQRLATMFFLLALSIPPAAPAAGDPPPFAPGGAPAGEAREALPTGAVLHVELTSIDRLLTDVNELGMRFLPAAMVPPDLRPALTQPRPIVSLLGMQAMGAPITGEDLAAISGLDLHRPVSFTLYPQDPQRSFVLTLPVSDPAAATGLVLNLASAPGHRKVAVGAGHAYAIEPGDPNLPGALLVVAAADTLHVTASRPLAEAILAGQAPPLGRAKLLARARALHGEANLWAAVDVAPFKPLLPRTRRWLDAPARLFPELRRRARAELDAESLRKLNLQLNLRLGIRDLDQLFDYTEAITVASWQTLFEALYEQAERFEGLTLALDVDERDQALDLLAHSRAIEAEGWTAPLPIEAIRDALARVPGTGGAFSATGRAPAPAGPGPLKTWLTALETQLTRRQLPLETFTAIRQYLLGRPPPPSLEETVAWRIRARIPDRAWPEPEAHDELATFLQAAWETAPLPGQLTVIPRQPAGALQRHYDAWVTAQRDGDAAYAELVASAGWRKPYLATDNRFHHEALAGGIQKLVLESSYTTPFGLFGFTEHELVNRWVAYRRDTGALTFLHENARTPGLLRALGERGRAPAPAVRRLLEQAPAGTTQIVLQRMLHLLPEAVDYLARVEQLAHRQLRSYLDWVHARQAASEDDATLLAELEGRAMPLLVHELRFNPDTGRFYLLLPGGRVFPRPSILGAAVELLAPYAEAAPEQGGLAIFTYVRDGEAGIRLVQDTDALATLVRTVAEEIHKQYLTRPHNLRKLRERWRSPGDGRMPEHHLAVLENPWWSAF